MNKVDIRHQTLDIRKDKRPKIQGLMSNVQLGFTLVELLVIISVFAIVIVIVNQLLFTTFKGASKAEASEKVKREGERVMGSIERSVRNARIIYSCGSSTLIYQDQYGSTATFSCSGIGTSSGYIASGSADIVANDVNVTSCSISCENVNGATKAVLVNATFAAKSNAVSPRSEEQGTVTLQSRILLRN